MNRRLLQLRIIDGAQAGAWAPLSVDSTIEIGGDYGSDIMLRDPLLVGQRYRLTIGEHNAHLTVVDGEVDVMGRQITTGEEAEVAPYTTIKMGDVTLAYGEKDDPRWENLMSNEKFEDILPQDSGQIETHSDITSLQLTEFPPAREKNIFATIAGSGILLFGLAMAVHALTDNSAPESQIISTHNKQQIDELLNTAGFSELSTVQHSPDNFVIKGYLESQVQHEKLKRLLAESNITSHLDITITEQLAAAVREVYRLNDISANVLPQGAGNVLVKTSEGDVKKLLNVETMAKRDIVGLNSIVVENQLPMIVNESVHMADDPNKRVASIVPGDPAYLVTADGTRYFVGAMLPTGHKISAIDEQQVLLDKNGITNTLRF